LGGSFVSRVSQSVVGPHFLIPKQQERQEQQQKLYHYNCMHEGER
jgi:hypothetical protein